MKSAAVICRCARGILPTLLVLVMTPSLCAQRPARIEDPYEDVLAGGDLNEAAVGDLEKRVAANPEDLQTRLKLLGFYLVKQASPDIAKARLVHVLWMIEHQPRHTITATPYCSVDPDLDAAGFAAAGKAWTAQVDKAPDDAVILGAAAHFYTNFDNAMAATLLNRAKKADPKNPDWPSQLAQVYSLNSESRTGAAQQEASSLALKEEELAYSLTTGQLQRSYFAPRLAKLAFNAADMAKAEQFAKQCLARAPNVNDWNSGNSTHTGNVILGRIALTKGDIPAAKAHLLAAGRTQGSPQLDSFGPNMALAKELLEKGEREVVLEYFQLCQKFWTSGAEQLKAWSEAVQAGRNPDFGSNLFY